MEPFDQPALTLCRQGVGERTALDFPACLRCVVGAARTRQNGDGQQRAHRAVFEDGPACNTPRIGHAKEIPARRRGLNTSLGMLLHWWHANKQQPGRGSVGKSSLQALRVLDVTALKPKQLPERMRQRIAISVVALPRVVDSEETSFCPASKGEALLALAPTSVMFLPSASPRPRSLDKIAKLVECVPCYWLKLGRDVNHIRDAVRRMVAAAEQT